MHAGLINQLMACAWLEAGREIESIQKRGSRSDEIMEKLAAIARRPKPKFNF
jgi:hypothetical protein